MSIQLLSSALPTFLPLSPYCPLPMNGSSALPSFPPVCPAYSFSFDPKAPPPLVPTLPPPSFLDRIWNLFSSAVSPQQVTTQQEPMTIKQAVDENDLPTLSNWLGKGDEELAKHLDPFFTSRWSQMPSQWSIRKGFIKLISRPAEEGNVPLVLKLLDRMQEAHQGEHHIFPLLEKVYLHAITRGQKNLIMAVLRKGYKVSPEEDPNGSLLKTAIQMMPNLALELSGEAYSLQTLQTAVKASINANQLKIVSAFLDRPEENELVPFAARYAAEKNKPDVLKDLVKRGLSDTDRLESLYLACEHGNREAARFLASQGALYLGDKKIVEKLLKWEILPTRFSQDLLKTRTGKEVVAMLQAYIRFGSIKDRDLIEAWPAGTFERFALFRAILLDRHAISNKMDKFLKSQFLLFSPEKQQVALRIAILKDRPEVFLNALMNSSSLSIAQKDELSVLRQQTKQFQMIKQQIIEKRRSVLASEWDPEKIREEVLAKGPEILQWRQRGSAEGDDRFVYFGSMNTIGQAKTMPHLILKSCRTRKEAEERFSLIERVREACKRKNLTHLRVPRAILVKELRDDFGKFVPVNLVIEEMLPVAGHEIYQVKDLLHKLNQDPRTRNAVNRYFRELTSLVCETGLSDLKATNVPLLADGSGLAIIDSNMQEDSVSRALYTFDQKDHALIHWIFPENYQALRDSLQQEDHCPKDLGSIAEKSEKERTLSYDQEQDLVRADLLDYGNQQDS